MLKFNQVLFQSCSFQGHFCPFDLCSTKLHLHPCIHILFFHRSANNFGIHILNLFLIRWQLLQHLELRLVEVGLRRGGFEPRGRIFSYEIFCANISIWNCYYWSWGEVGSNLGGRRLQMEEPLCSRIVGPSIPSSSPLFIAPCGPKSQKNYIKPSVLPDCQDL